MKSEIPLTKLGMENNSQRQQQTVVLCRILRPGQFCARTQTELAEKIYCLGCCESSRPSGNACLGPRSAADAGNKITHGVRPHTGTKYQWPGEAWGGPVARQAPGQLPLAVRSTTTQRRSNGSQSCANTRHCGVLSDV